VTQAPPSDRARVRRHPERGRYDRASIDAILDEAYVCHLGFVLEGQPYVVPTMFARDGDRVIVHGSAASRMTRTLATGIPVALTVTLLDGLVLARSATNHSMNYRSVVVLGAATPVEEREAKLAAMRVLVERVAPGRWAVVREPSDQELRATTILELPLDEASAKVRTGPPVDDEEDLAREVWAGVLPLGLVATGEPEPDVYVPVGLLPGPDVDAAVRRSRPRP
jgi:nitroimidazol reductase NimA-like FMN-containing flavoprotein (pyridoxamine 5'-phosphate oxidase superfamily)